LQALTCSLPLALAFAVHRYDLRHRSLTLAQKETRP
jgi:hypothetical protein